MASQSKVGLSRGFSIEFSIAAMSVTGYNVYQLDKKLRREAIERLTRLAEVPEYPIYQTLTDSAQPAVESLVEATQRVKTSDEKLGKLKEKHLESTRKLKAKHEAEMTEVNSAEVKHFSISQFVEYVMKMIQESKTKHEAEMTEHVTKMMRESKAKQEIEMMEHVTKMKTEFEPILGERLHAKRQLVKSLGCIANELKRPEFESFLPSAEAMEMAKQVYREDPGLLNQDILACEKAPRTFEIPAREV